MRFYLKMIAAATLALTLMVGAASQVQTFEQMEGLNTPQDHGWVAPEQAFSPLKGAPAPSLKSGRGQVRLLYKDWKEATGYVYIPRHQSAPDCVGQSMAGGLDLRMAVQAVHEMYRVPQQETDASSIYGLSRIEIAGKPAFSPGGSNVIWAMQAMSEYGALFRKDYLYAGYNLTKYDPSRSRSWGSRGLPSVLESVAKLTPLVDYYQVSNYEEVRDAIANGYPVVVGSGVGFSRRTIFSWGQTKATRDSEGFLTEKGGWNHAMLFGGVDDRSARKGVCCMNSWGPSWVNGSTRLEQPPGSFWIDARTVTKMVSQGDAFAIVRVRAPLSYRLLK